VAARTRGGCRGPSASSQATASRSALAAKSQSVRSRDARSARPDGLARQDADQSCSVRHDFFMRFPIDVVFIDKTHTIVKIVHSLGRGRRRGRVELRCTRAAGGTAAALELESGCRSCSQTSRAVIPDMANVRAIRPMRILLVTDDGPYADNVAAAPLCDTLTSHSRRSTTTSRRPRRRTRRTFRARRRQQDRPHLAHRNSLRRAAPSDRDRDRRQAGA